MNNNKGFREKTTLGSFSTDALRETLYTCPANCRSRVVLVNVDNVAGNATVNLEVYKAATDSRFYLLFERTLLAGDFIRLDQSYFVLEPGDRLEVQPNGTTPRLDAICTVEEIFIPVG